MNKSILLVCMVLLSVAVCAAQGKSVDGQWRGIWTSPSGAVFTAEATMMLGPACKTCAVQGTPEIKGWIKWTLRKAGKGGPPVIEGGGPTATESVLGEMKGEGFLVLKGVGKEDPDNVISLEQYRLALADNGDVMGGITRNGGAWTGQLLLVRVQP